MQVFQWVPIVVYLLKMFSLIIRYVYSMLSLSGNNRDDVIEVFKSASIYLNNLLPQIDLKRDCNGKYIE